MSTSRYWIPDEAFEITQRAADISKCFEENLPREVKRKRMLQAALIVATDKMLDALKAN